MANFYTYLISSIPMLHFGMKPPFSWERFLQVCQELIPQKDLQILSTLPQAEEYSLRISRRPIIQAWIEFDTALRNELVRTRASRKHIEPDKYLRLSNYSGPALGTIALSAQRSPSVVDAEKILDLARWQALEELVLGHYFDLDFLITYAYKLLILQRWEKASTQDKTALFEQSLAH